MTRGVRWLLPLAVVLLGGGNLFSAEAPPARKRAEVQAVLDQVRAAAPAGPLRPLHVVLIADKKDHGPGEHDYPLWQQRWKILLGGASPEEAAGAQVNLCGPPAADPTGKALKGAPQVKLSTAWQWPSAEQMQSADLLVMFCYRSGAERRTWSEERIKDLDAYLSRGGGFVAIHSATYTPGDMSRPEAQQTVGLTGLVFDKSILVRHGPMTVRIAAPEHPICRGLPATIEWTDEPYWPPVGDVQAVEVLATSEEAVAKGAEERKPQPMFWTYAKGKGRVFGCVPGHFNWTFDDPLFRLLLLRGMAWAARESPYRFDELSCRGADLAE